jgi:uncharacterized protein (TIGR02246 family)
MTSASDSKQVEDVASVKRLYAAMIRGWNEGSGEVFAAEMDEEIDYVGFDGTLLEGRAEVARFHDRLFRTTSPGRA